MMGCELSEYLMSNVTWHTSAGYQMRDLHKRIYCEDGYNLIRGEI